MKKWELLLLICGAVLWVALQSLWPFIGEKYYFIGDSSMRLALAIVVYCRFKNVVTWSILYLCFNDIIDDIFCLNEKYRWSEYASYIMALIINIMLLLKKKRKCKKNLIG